MFICADNLVTYLHWFPLFYYEGYPESNLRFGIKKTSSFNHADHSFTIWRVNVV